MPLPTHPGDLFTWNKTHGVAWVSDFPSFKEPTWGTCGPVSGQMWSDACDMGFKVKSHRTGQEVLFVLENEERGEDGVVAWNYRSANGHLTVRIYND